MQFFNWLITSSADPRKTSLAVKAMLTIAGAYALNFVEIACKFANKCLPITETWLTSSIDAATDLTFYVTAAIGSLVALYGLFRKLAFGRWSAQ